jgi:hypothetical protein
MAVQVSATTGVAIGLSTLGAAAELVGLLLVVREIANDRERGRRLLLKLEAPPSPERHYPPRFTPSMSPPEYANPAWSQSMHVEGVIRHVRQLEAAVGNGFIGLRKTMDAEVDGAVHQLAQDAAERDRELADGLRYVLAGSTRDRVIGVVLLAVGIVLGLAGSVVGNLA